MFSVRQGRNEDSFRYRKHEAYSKVTYSQVQETSVQSGGVQSVKYRKHRVQPSTQETIGAQSYIKPREILTDTGNTMILSCKLSTRTSKKIREFSLLQQTVNRVTGYTNSIHKKGLDKIFHNSAKKCLKCVMLRNKWRYLQTCWTGNYVCPR